MEKILNQEEIDQLFRAAQKQQPAKRAAEKRRVVSECDFRQAGQFTKEQVRQLTHLHDNFAPNLANSLGAYLRVAFDINLVSIEQLNYTDFLGRLPEQTYFAALLINPMEETAGIQMDVSLVFPMIDLLLGGPGKGLDEPRDLTEIEEQIVESVVSVICRELQLAWQQALPLEFAPGPRMKLAQIMNLMSPSERVLNLSFELRLGELRGALNLIFPALISNALLRKLALQGMVRRRRPSAVDSARVREHLLDSKIHLNLELTHIAVAIRDLSDLHVGQVISMRHSVHAPMTLLANSTPLFTAQPVSCGAMRGGLIRAALPPPEMNEKDRP